MKFRAKRVLAGLLAAAMLAALPGCQKESAKWAPIETPAPTDAVIAVPPETNPVPPEDAAGQDNGEKDASDKSGSEKDDGEKASGDKNGSGGSDEEKEPLRKASGIDDIQSELYDAICGVRQPERLEVSGIDWQYAPDLDVKNLYHGLMGQHPELKYAYDISAAVNNGVLTCQVSYMPYKTGDYPAGKEYLTVSTFEELIAAAQAHLGKEPVPVRLADTAWLPEQAGRALAQVGGGYILCSLNRDGTEIVYSPPMGMEMKDCLSELEEAGRLADELLAGIVSDNMTAGEKALAIYSYLTENVEYDQRYYSDPANLPYQSRTALGALRDKVAICGGYSNALKLLFEKVGIPCYTVSGSYFQESHMWNVAYLDGAWRWFDATIDRGNSEEYGFLRFAMETLDTRKYQWNPDSIDMLLN